MSQWDQWFRGFIKAWFVSVAKGLSKLEKGTRTSVLDKFSNIQTNLTPLSSFNDTWKEFRGESEVITQVHKSLDTIYDFDDATKEFLSQWMATLLESLEAAGGTVISEVLSFSGRICAEAHAQNIFVEQWKEQGEKWSLF